MERLGGVAKVVSCSGRGPVMVQAGALKVRIAPDEARILDAGSPRPPKPTPPKDTSRVTKPRASTSGAAGDPELNHFREPQTTCDLRGLRVEETEEELARFIDSMLLAEVPSVLIIHGHGTGALRQVVRQQLRHSEVVSQSRPGRRDEGGDGVTVAFFRS